MNLNPTLLRHPQQVNQDLSTPSTTTTRTTNDQFLNENHSSFLLPANHQLPILLQLQISTRLLLPSSKLHHLQFNVLIFTPTNPPMLSTVTADQLQLVVANSVQLTFASNTLLRSTNSITASRVHLQILHRHHIRKTNTMLLQLLHRTTTHVTITTTTQLPTA